MSHLYKETYQKKLWCGMLANLQSNNLHAEFRIQGRTGTTRHVNTGVIPSKLYGKWDNCFGILDYKLDKSTTKVKMEIDLKLSHDYQK